MVPMQVVLHSFSLLKLQPSLQKTEMVEGTTHTMSTTESPLQGQGVVPQTAPAEVRQRPFE